MSEVSREVSFEYELDTEDPGKGLWIVLGIIVLIIGAFIFLRTEPSNVGSVNELATILTDGRPKQYLRHSGSINRADLSDLGEDLVNKNRLRSLRK